MTFKLSQNLNDSSTSSSISAISASLGQNRNDSSTSICLARSSQSPFAVIHGPAPPSLYQLASASDAGSLAPLSTGDIHPRYELRTQSNLVTSELFDFRQDEINKLLFRDLQGRGVQVSDAFVETLFPDAAFGFPINNPFIRNFRGSLISTNDCIDIRRVGNEKITTDFLNSMVSTIATFLASTKKSSLKPLRYFSSRFSSIPLGGHPVKRKPDITLFRLINGCTRLEIDGMRWQDVQGMIEHTRERKTPKRMVETVAVKSYMTFCMQPERDFVPFICIVGDGFQVKLVDHEGHIETAVFPFSHTTSTQSTLIFFRMIMGLAFLPDELIGLDPSIKRREQGSSSGLRFCDLYPPEQVDFVNPSIQLLIPTPEPSIDAPAVLNPSILPLVPVPEPSIDSPSNVQSAPPGFDDDILSVTAGSNVYPVVRLLFASQALIGRSTRAFLVRLPDGRLAVLKDSWSLPHTHSEAMFLDKLNIPFGPQLVDHCVRRNTASYRDNSINTHLKGQSRQKRRTVTYPAGVPISDFISLWELMVAMLDVVIAILFLARQGRLHRDISYTNILLRCTDDDLNADKLKEARRIVMEGLGLSEIENLRNELNCREGLLIDFDYGEFLIQLDSPAEAEPDWPDHANRENDVEEDESDEEPNDEKDSNAFFPPTVLGARTGTAPFIAMELLIYCVPHRVAHDLESLFYVLLFTCSHLQGPFNHLADTPLFPPFHGPKANQSPSLLKEWFNTAIGLSTLGHLKYSHITGHFESHVLQGISPYFAPLKKHLSAFLYALFPQQPSKGREAVYSLATPEDIIKVLKNALLDEKLIDSARKQKVVLGKRSRPGDLTMRNWGSVKNRRKTNSSPSISRQTNTMSQGASRGKHAKNQ